MCFLSTLNLLEARLDWYIFPIIIVIMNSFKFKQGQKDQLDNNKVM